MPPVDGEMNIRTFLSSRQTLSEIVDELEIAFRTLANAKSVKVLRGTKGSLPSSKHALDMLTGLWKEMSKDQDWKKKVISSYVEKYIQNLITARPDVLLHPVADANPVKVLIYDAVSEKPPEHATFTELTNSCADAPKSEPEKTGA